MKNFSIARFLISVLVLVIITQIIYMLDGFVGMDYYTNPANAGIWSKYMMPEAGPPPASFYYMSIAFNLIGTLLFVGVYAILKKAMPGTSPSSKGFIYGLLTFLIAGVPGFLSMILLINLPLGLICLWTAEDLIVKTVGGTAAGLINK